MIHGCLTGDCPHDTQAECDAVIRLYAAELEQENARLRAALGELLDIMRNQKSVPPEFEKVFMENWQDILL